ncbi:MAG: hypothetical protein KatS3mg105_1719 [Gemmatales bacterium]|nr:MAG: hypothetical protein KatS3mg105_1719 [Gemmatales bacterium]
MRTGALSTVSFLHSTACWKEIIICIRRVRPWPWARAARFNWDNRYAARATQAILTLLTETRVDAKQGSRFTILPSVIVNRLGAAGLTVAAIHELPAPQKDLLDQGEQFCVFIRRCQEKNGALRFSDNVHHKEGINEYPGQALYGLLLSQRHRPAKWKSDLAFHALPYYRSWWRENKNMDFVAWQSLAFTEAYLQTGNKEFADFVFEMNDWLVRLQYPPLDPRRPLWGGGFKSWSEGKEVETAPDIRSALYAESLAAAWRAAGRAGDLKRHQNYGEALQHCLQFLSRLQYTEANTQHFADWYRPRLLGAFHGSLEDGNIRVDYTQHAVYAMLLYLEGAVR